MLELRFRTYPPGVTIVTSGGHSVYLRELIFSRDSSAGCLVPFPLELISCCPLFLSLDLLYFQSADAPRHLPSPLSCVFCSALDSGYRWWDVFSPGKILSSHAAIPERREQMRQRSRDDGVPEGKQG